MRRAPTACALALALAACASHEKPAPRPRPPVRELGHDRYFQVVAVGDRVVTARHGPPPDPLDTDPIWEVVTPATGARKPLDLPQGVCPRKEYVRAFPIDDHRVGFTRDCSLTSYDLVAYDVTTGRAEVLPVVVKPGADVALLSRTDVLASYDSSICAYLVRYGPTGRVPLGIELEKDGWPLEDAHGVSDCGPYGLVTEPAVSRQGVLAFLASPDSRGKHGRAKVYSAWYVYVVRDGVARAVAKAPGHPFELVWSPDGSTMYVASDHRDEGVYAVTPEGRVTLLTADPAGPIAPLAHALVMLSDDGDDDYLTERLVVLPLPSDSST